MNQPLPVGVDDFKELVLKKYYYVDKTLLIKELLDKKGKVTLFTRPRRFGKTLNLSMLKYYFENTGDEERNRQNAKLFSELAISSAGEFYLSEMVKYPVITFNLKSAKQRSYELAFKCLTEAIAEEFARHESVVSKKLKSKFELDKYIRICTQQAEDAEYYTSLSFLSKCLCQAYGKKCILLIDEYDVPLENAYFAGYYDDMVAFIRSLFESVLKTNPYLEWSVLTGCLRISRESIFTGLNNLEIVSILRNDFGEYFGFMQPEVDKMLETYAQVNSKGLVKQWYNGYLFGNTEVYNPWSIVNFVKVHAADENAFPEPYWANTSSNSIVKNLVERIDDEEGSTIEELENLMNGGTIEKPVHEDISYDSIYDCEDNLWNFLFFYRIYEENFHASGRGGAVYYYGSAEYGSFLYLQEFDSYMV